ncbi:MAG TPA: T9SS type A sorting domain-containing protein [Candidatus Cloacimonetes bacterium]|nr:T9SS type A sorting domain-containing protein [Candidatus Cloacimonadota bacterium]HEX38329.1 T9SS type A sorting domain-containing protein [Candidatus Cloacimonadota bacterium]
MKSLILFLGVIFIITFPLFADWSDDPAVNNAVCTLAGEQAITKVGTGPTGDTYFGYFSNESGNYNVRLQRFDQAGNPLWVNGGILVSDNTQMTWLTDWDMTVDLDNNAVLTFQDIRDGNNNVYAYKISPDGTFLWGADGLQLSNTSAFDAAPKVTVTTNNNVVIAWGSEDVSRLQKISPEGVLLWDSTGIEISGANSYTWPQPIGVESDHVIVKYYEDSGPVWAPTRHIYAQKFDANGNTVWDSPAAISTAGGITAWTQDLPIVKDNDNGFFIGWYDDRDNNMNADVYVQHVDADGNCLWTANGVIASTDMNREHYYVYIAYQPDEDILYAYWNEMDYDQNDRGIYGQKFDMTGTRKWEDTGRVIIEISPVDVYPYGIGNVSGKVVVFYQEGLNENYLKAMALDSTGDFVWPGGMITMCSVAATKLHAMVGSLNSNFWIASWADDRNGNADIFAQNINTDGTLGYSPQAHDPEMNDDQYQVYAQPNPFRNSTSIRFYTTGHSDITEISIYNVKGQLVRNLTVAFSPLHIVEATWDGKDTAGQNVKPGIYLYKITVDKKEIIQKIVKI